MLRGPQRLDAAGWKLANCAACSQACPIPVFQLSISACWVFPCDEAFREIGETSEAPPEGSSPRRSIVPAREIASEAGDAHHVEVEVRAPACPVSEEEVLRNSISRSVKTAPGAASGSLRRSMVIQ